MSGLNITWNGKDGQIKVVGLGAVLATFSDWTLKSRGENRREKPMWDLHGFLSYVNATLYRQLLDNGYEMRISLVTQGKTYDVSLEGNNVEIVDNRIIIKEITLDARD